MAENSTPVKYSKKENREMKELATDFVLSGASAAISKTLVAPLERVKVVLQTQTSNISMITNKSKMYAGISDCFLRTFKEQGFLSFWRGNLATLLKYVPLQALNFTLHAKLKRMFPKYDTKKDKFKFVLSNLVKGALAGGSSLVVIYPLDYIKTKMAADQGNGNSNREFTGFIDCVKKIVQKGGVSSFYTAFPLSLVNVMVYRGIYFGFYESLMRDQENTKSSIWASFLYAQVSTNSAGLVVYPFDTVRRNLVLQSARSLEHQKLLKDSGMVECAKRLYRERGLRGLYGGCLINLFRGFGSSLVLVFYNELKIWTKSDKQ